MLKNLFISVLSKTFGNKLFQTVLEKNIKISQYFMGIGAGSNVSASGEKQVVNLIKKNCTSPYMIFDVGANKGQFLKMLTDSLQEDRFCVHCFEPGKVTFSILSNNAVKSNNIILNNIGLGKENGQVHLYYNEEGSGLASLTKRKLDHHGKSFSKHETVSIKTLDEYCCLNSINHISLLKIDVEGHELDVLTGAKGMFEKHAIDIVTFEFGGCNIDTKTYFQNFWYFFLEVSMKVYRITPSGYLYEILSYKEIEEQFRTTNYIAIKSN